MAKSIMKIFGAVLVLVGIVGFFVPFTGLLDLTLAHNLVHLASGIIFLAVSGSDKNSVLTAKIFGIVYLLVAVLGLITTDVLGLITLDAADTAIHFVLTIGLLLAGFKGQSNHSVNKAA